MSLISQNATPRRAAENATGSFAIRVAIWLLALVATAGAVISIDRVLRNRSTANDVATTPVIMPPAGGEHAASKAVEAAAQTVAALTGPGEEPRRRDDAARDGGVPAFDVARVEPSGETVIAGRAAPGSTVELLRNGQVHDRVTVDASGQFVIVPPKLPVGESELTLRAKPREGAPVTSAQTVVVAVQPNLKDQPVVAVMTPDKPTVVLSKPAPAQPPAEAAPAGSVVVETVEAEPAGRKLYVSGHSAPGALVRLYLNDSYHSTATADASGRVSFTVASSEGERSSDYRVRLDEVDRLSGAIRSRAEVPFTPPQAVAAVAATRNGGDANAANAVVAAASAGDANAAPGASAAATAGLRVQKGQVMTVSRGDSLWRISRLAYGDGTRYTVIYDANHKQIRNPNRIYPGQVFIIPGKGQ
jgi:nucleoid-associated protein YgaU